MHVERRFPRSDPLLRPAALHDGVGTGGDRVGAFFPPGNGVCARVGVDLTAKMVDDDGDVGMRPREPGESGQALVVGRIVVVAEVVFPEDGVAFLESGVEFRGQWEAYPAKVGRGGHVRFEHRLDRLAEIKIGAAEDSRAEAHIAVLAGPAHRGDAVNELCLADGLHLFRPVRAVERPALGKDRLDHVVPRGADVLGHLLAQVHFLFPADMRLAVGVPAIPQVVVGIDDGQFRLQHVFLGSPGQPLLKGRVLGICHGRSFHFKRGPRITSRVRLPRPGSSTIAAAKMEVNGETTCVETRSRRHRLWSAARAGDTSCSAGFGRVDVGRHARGYP